LFPDVNQYAFIMSFKAFLTSRTFLRNIITAIVVTIVILWAAMYLIRVYTHHGESFAVPDFSGMDLEQVGQLTKQKNLIYEVVDSLYTKDAKPGTVIDQVPVPGFHVKEERTVFLTICAQNPEQVAMPRLTDISLRQAVNIMQSAGLNVGEMTYVPSEYPNLVLAQKQNGVSIPEGKPVNKGSEIDLVVGKSSSGEKTVVPNLIGVTLDQAENEIAALVLSIGAVIYDESVLNLGDSLKARVWQQRPDASLDDEVDQGTSIDLWLTVEEGKINDGTEAVTEPEPENELNE